MRTKAMELETWECTEFKSSLDTYLAKSEIDLCKCETILFAVFYCGQLGWHLLEGVGTYLPLVLYALVGVCVCVRMSTHVSHWLILYRSADSGSWVSLLPGESTRPPKDKKKSTESTVSLTHNRWPWRFYSAKGRSEGLSLCTTSRTHTHSVCALPYPLYCSMTGHYDNCS